MHMHIFIHIVMHMHVFMHMHIYLCIWKFHVEKRHFTKHLVFCKIQLHLHFWAKAHHARIFWCKTDFFYFTIWKPRALAFQSTLTLDRYLFNSRSNFHVNLIHCNSLHPKKAILPTFSGQTPHFVGNITKPELTTYTIGKLSPLRSFWVKGWGQT